MQARTERFEMRLDQDDVSRIDDWRAKQPDLPSRSEAARRLMEKGLADDQPGAPLSLRGADRLMASMLCEIAKKLKIDGGIDPDFVQDAMYGGHLWALEWQYPGLFRVEDTPPEIVSQVVGILDMWSFLQEGFAALSKADQKLVSEKAHRSDGKLWFPGFDGNNEGEHLSIAHFLVDKMDRLSSFKGKIYNSHFPVLDGYLRMVARFKVIRPTLADRKRLSADQIIELLLEGQRRR